MWMAESVLVLKYLFMCSGGGGGEDERTTRWVFRLPSRDIFWWCSIASGRNNHHLSIDECNTTAYQLMVVGVVLFSIGGRGLGMGDKIIAWLVIDGSENFSECFHLCLMRMFVLNVDWRRREGGKTLAWVLFLEIVGKFIASFNKMKVEKCLLSNQCRCCVLHRRFTMMRKQLPHNNWYCWYVKQSFLITVQLLLCYYFPHHQPSIDTITKEEGAKLLHHKMSAFQLTMIDYERV